MDDAERVYDEALPAILPNYPLVLFGKGRVLAANDVLDHSIGLISGVVERSPHTGNLIFFGDVLKQGGLSTADEIYQLADSADILGDTHDAPLA